MAKIINITDKFSNDKPKIVIGKKEFEVNDSIEAVLKFEELSNEGSVDALKQAIKITLGEKAVDDFGINKISISNFKVLTVAIMAAIQGIDYEEAEKRFHQI